jgi:LysM repeat protein
VTFPLKPGEVHPIDNAMQTLFGLTNSGGSVVITTDTLSSLMATARTYNQTENGTYGQFIPGIAPQESVGLGERTLQILQLESSTRFRTNVGVTETKGEAVTLLVTAIPSDSKIAASTTITLAPNEFRQFSLDAFGLGTLYNARVTVKVLGGTGKVTAYGSVIDQVTQDPTYVLAQ